MYANISFDFINYVHLREAGAGSNVKEVSSQWAEDRIFTKRIFPAFHDLPCVLCTQPFYRVCGDDNPGVIIYP